MHIEAFRDHCLGKSGVTESFPFDDRTLVFKVGGKMFALTDIDDFKRINLKCDPQWAEQLREEHPAIIPGFHMNKKHWNTVMMDGSLTEDLIYRLIDHSYELVYRNLPQKLRG